MESEAYKILDLDHFWKLFACLQERGYDVVGPTIRDDAIVYDELSSVSDLPIGWTDEQSPGKYRLKRRMDLAYFGYNVGPHSWKKYLFPPRRKLWEASKDEKGFTVKPEPLQTKKLAFLGIRSCEIEAIFIQDKVFIEGKHVDAHYKSQRDQAFLIAVNCTQAASTCFCRSMKTGPKAKRGYDLSLTEVINGKDHFFVASSGSDEGEALLAELELPSCTEDQISAAENGIAKAEQQMDEGFGMDTTDIKELLYRNVDNPHWDKLSDRCLSCGNCTLVCPTCFCSDVQETTDLTGDHTERWMTWDSCFNASHSYIHGGSVRTSTQSRYRQWITHKLGSWIDQFGSSGCVGCGRCVAWCPVGIDIREEIQAVRESEETETSS